MRAALVSRLVDDRWDTSLEDAARAAAVAVDVPIGAVTLVGDRLVHFVAHVGLPAELEVSRAVAVELACDRAVVERGAAVVCNDGRGNPTLRPELLHAWEFCAYVGFPIDVDGVVVGALCGVDRVARAFGNDDVAALAGIAAGVGRRLKDKLTARAHAVDDDARVELAPFLRLLQAAQVGALPPDALVRALRVLPPAPLPAR